MRVVVTGAAGFLGSHVVRILVGQGAEVHAVVRSSTDLWRIRDIQEGLRMAVCDLESRESVASLVRSVQPEVCYHFSWADGRDLNAFSNIDHLRPSVDLASSLAQAGCRRFVGVGTVHEYDTSLRVLAESSPISPLNVHAATKIAFLAALRQLQRTSQMRYTWVRPFFHYGPYEQPRRLVRSVIEALRNGQPARTTSGEQVRDYLHVEDAAAGICAAAEAGLPCANICSGVAVPLRDIVLRIGEIMNATELLHIGELPQRQCEPPYICGNNELLRSATGWKPRYDLENGICQTIDWWSRYGRA